jgi:hypothetical protein
MAELPYEMDDSNDDRTSSDTAVGVPTKQITPRISLDMSGYTAVRTLPALARNYGDVFDECSTQKVEATKEASDAEWQALVRELLPPGTHVYEWDVDVDIDGLPNNIRGIPAQAEWVGLVQGGTGSVRFRFAIQSKQPLDEEASALLAVGRAIKECAAWSSDAEVLGYRTFLNRRCLT